jgi:uncharacterized protein YdaU (DUF1376 family)
MRLRTVAVQKSPAFQFYAKDFLTGTAAMTLAERGAYVTLLAHEWDAGSVPALAQARARILGCTKAQERAIWSALAPKFVLREDAYVNERLEHERRLQSEYRRRQSDNGKASAAARKGNQAHNQTPNQKPTVVEPPLQPLGQPLGQPKPNSPVFSLQKEQKDPPTAHPVRELLAEHERCFIAANHGEKPAKYTGKDAKHAKDLIEARGPDRAVAIVRQAFISTDPFIANSGRSMGVIASSTIQNKLIAELATRRPLPDEKPKTLRDIDEMEAKRHAV